MRSIAGADAELPEGRHQLQPRLRIPQDLPASISRHVIPVTGPEDVLREFQSRRERNYHLLIHRFVYQILYGCANAACTTPTCLSYQRRTTKIPLRKLTPLSARTLACYLASESNPEDALCPYCPQVCPDHEQLPLVKRRPRRKSHNVTFESDGKTARDTATGKFASNGHISAPRNGSSRPSVLVRSAWDAPQLEGVKEYPGEPQSLEQRTDEGWKDSKAQKPSTDRPPRDSKSFTQSLFDTLPLRMLEWLPFQPRRTDNIQSRSTRDETVEHDEGPETSAHKTLERVLDGAAMHHDRTATTTILQKPARHVPSRSPPQIPGTDLQILPNGDVRPFSHDTVQRPTRTIRRRMSKAEKERSIESVEAPPASLSFPHDSKAPYPRRPSLPYSVELRPKVNSEPMAPKQRSRQSSDTHQQPPSHDDGHDSDVEDSLTGDSRSCPNGNMIRPTYTLARIPSTTFTEIGRMQESFEEYCLGYQVTERRLWPDEPNPRTDLALTYLDWTDFVKQSCFYLLKDSFRLASAFNWNSGPEKIVDSVTWPTSILAANGLKIFGSLYRLRPSEEILQFLSFSLDQVFLSTLGLMRLRKQTKRDEESKRSSGKQSIDPDMPVLSNNQAAFICAVVLYALNRLTAIKHPCRLQDHADRSWRAFCSLRAAGRILPADVIAELDQAHELDCYVAHWKGLTDVFANDMALEVVSKLAKAISNRFIFSKISRAREKQGLTRKGQSVLQVLVQHLKDSLNQGSGPILNPRPLPLSSTTLEWLRTIVLRDWDGQPIVRRASTVGGALKILAAMYEDRLDLQLDPDDFHTPFFAERLDSMEMPVEWLSYQPDNKTFHLLSYTFLFPPSTLVTYFRALNFATMSKSFEAALVSSKHVSQLTYSHLIQVANDVQLLNTMRPSTATYLVLTVRRDNVLTDAMNQLWRRQKRELMRPLKVRMGMDEGEEGVDHGGVQQEFFRCLLAEALDPAYGMFTVDERTRMTWFQPGSLEPLYKFEMLGILFSIAVYNSITLPVTFPLAFYRKLLDLPVKKLKYIQDGWPDLAKGLQDLLDWSDGDVGDVFTRTYEFSFDVFGKHVDVDMQKVTRKAPWPATSKKTKGRHSLSSIGPTSTPATNIYDQNLPDSPHNHITESHPPSSPAGPSTSSPNTTTTPTSILVTNANRHQYVTDHISHLTNHSISPQFTAFSTGFHTCLTRTALSLFTPPALQSLLQGSSHISLPAWRAITRYEDGYTADSALIRDFWTVVGGFDDAQRRGLLEFVTASERVPVAGWENVVFIVQRSGFDDARLPTSMTCFGRLLLPQYSGRAVLEEKLRKAVEHSKGFGVA